MNMRILGIDPGLRTTGFGVIELHGHQLHYIASGTIRTASAAAAPPDEPPAVRVRS